MQNNVKPWAVISLALCLVWNYAVLHRLSVEIIPLLMIGYFFTLYKIATLRGFTGWFAVFGILNILGLLIVLFAPKDKTS